MRRQRPRDSRDETITTTTNKPLGLSRRRPRKSPRLLWTTLIALLQQQQACAAVTNTTRHYHRDLSDAIINKQEMIRVVVGFHDTVSPYHDGIYDNSYNNYEILSTFRRTNAQVMLIPLADLELWSSRPDVAFVDPDYLVYPQYIESKQQQQHHHYTTSSNINRQLQDLDTSQSETVPYAIPIIQADDDRIPLAAVGNGECFRICIVDSGVLLPHPDLPFVKDDPTINGLEFGIDPTNLWDQAVAFSRHGTHVMGTMIAQGGNNQGIRGIINDPQNMCVSIARVFDDLGNGAPNSDVDRSLEWCADQGAKVINLSLGSKLYNSNSAAIYQQLEADGILIVAAVGNGGENIDFYPASYDGVMSVSSISDDLSHSTFSNFNNDVDLSAPGEEILSTAPRLGLFDEDGEEYVSAFITAAPEPSQTVSAVTVDCGQGDFPCTDAAESICIMQRGFLAVEIMALNCQSGGGIGVIIYWNDADGPFVGTDLPAYFGTIPIVELDGADGAKLLTKRGAIMTLQVPSYAFLGGTSMAAPHVAAVAAKIWAARPQCTMQQVREAMFETARDLGEPGRDQRFGYGLVQAYDAYSYLLTLPSPCGIPNVTVVSEPEIEGSQIAEDESEPPSLSLPFIRKVPPPDGREGFKLDDSARKRGSVNRLLPGDEVPKHRRGRLKGGR